jgi:hypothetical protein
LGLSSQSYQVADAIGDVRRIDTLMYQVGYRDDIPHISGEVIPKQLRVQLLTRAKDLFVAKALEAARKRAEKVTWLHGETLERTVRDNIDWEYLQAFNRAEQLHPREPLITGNGFRAFCWFWARLYLLFIPYGLMICVLRAFRDIADPKRALAVILNCPREIITASVFWFVGAECFNPEKSLHSRIWDLTHQKYDSLNVGRGGNFLTETVRVAVQAEVEIEFCSRVDVLIATLRGIWVRDEKGRTHRLLRKEWRQALYLSLVATVFVFAGEDNVFAAEGKTGRPILTGWQLVYVRSLKEGPSTQHMFLYFNEGKQTIGVYGYTDANRVIEGSIVIAHKNRGNVYLEVGPYADFLIAENRVVEFGLTGFLKAKIGNGILALPAYLTRTPEGVTGAYVPAARLTWPIGRSKARFGIGAAAFFSEGRKPNINIGPLWTYTLTKGTELRLRVTEKLQKPHGGALLRLDLVLGI